MRVLSRRVSTRSALVAAACVLALPACAASPTASSTPTSAATATADGATADGATGGTTAGGATGDRATGGTAGGPAGPTPASAARSCGAAFTTTPKSRRATRTNPLVAVRAGRHTCFERLVLEFRGPVTGYQVRYVDEVRADGSGELVPLAGGAALQVTVIAPAYDGSGGATYVPRNRARVVDVSGFAALRQVAWAGSFEGSTTLGVGVRRVLPFRVLVVAGPGGRSRVVVDVAQQR
jgi:hypothetical protein